MKNNIRIKIVLLLLLPFMTMQHSKSQDAPLSQFNNSPLLLNPANTGNFYGDWRAALNYRNQWAVTGEAYKTAVLSGDKLFTIFNQKVGAGLIFISDQSGGQGINKNKIYASGSYYYDYGVNHFSAGLQTGIVFNSIGNSTWNIFDPNTGTFTQSNGEPVAAEGSSYVDINFGILWQRKFGKLEPEAGLALSSLNAPNQSLLNSTDRVPMTTKIHASAKYNINDEIYTLPTFLFATSNGNLQSIIGANVGYKLLGNRSSVKQVFGGLYIKNGLGSELSDFTILAGTTVGRLDIAVNYDLNLSNLSQTNKATSFEISLIYKSLSTVLNSYSIPCERF
jgi:type IX secretion system PorP/SprF family membrane protein